MGTILQIYKVGSLDYAKNMIIEDIESYLTNKCSLMYEDTKFQYLPLAYTKSIKIDLSNTSFSPDLAKNIASIVPSVGDYVKTTNQANADADSFIAYYYITNADWRAEKTVLLTLTLDVLNTFYSTFASKFSARTRTTRQHKDRFYPTDIGNGYHIRKFYDTNEGFNPAKYLTNKIFWSDLNSYGLMSESQNFYLIDKTPTQSEQERENKVVNSFLTFDKNAPINIGMTGYFNNLKDIADYFESMPAITRPMFAVAEVEHNPHLTILNNTNNEKIVFDNWFNAPILMAFVPTFSGDDVDSISIGLYKYFMPPIASRDLDDYLINGITNILIVSSADFEKVSFLNFKSMAVQGGANWLDYYASHKFFSNYTSLNQINGSSFYGAGDYSKIDITDYSINNVFVLPYSPVPLNISYIGGNYLIDNDNLTIDTDNQSMLYIKDKIDYERSWTIGSTIGQDYFEAIYNKNLVCKIAEAQASELESRLYGSEFFSWGIWFAGQELLINNEKFSTNGTTYPQFILKYKVSNEFTGHFYFSIEFADTWQYKGLNNPTDLTLYVSKDNRGLLLQNSYLDYRKTMQQYDKQSLAIAQSQTWFNVGSTIANSLLMSAISVGAGGLTPLGITQRGIGLASSISGNLGNAIFAQINNENALRQKETSLAVQRSTIRSGADVSLQTSLLGNKLYFVQYSISDLLRQNLYRYFKYYGYACNDYGVPSLNTRRWWNYIECEADFNMSGLEVYVFYLTHIKEKLRQGCTIYHKYNNDWDLTQAKQNWESWYTE